MKCNAFQTTVTLTVDAGLYVWRADEGAFDAAGTAVARGISQVGDETVLFGWGSQYTHGENVHPCGVACMCSHMLLFIRIVTEGSRAGPALDSSGVACCLQAAMSA